MSVACVVCGSLYAAGFQGATCDPTVALITTGSGTIVPSAPCPVAGWLKQSLLIISMFLCGAMAAAGQDHSVLLKSDATVAAFGENLDGPAVAEQLAF